MSPQHWILFWSLLFALTDVAIFFLCTAKLFSQKVSNGWTSYRKICFIVRQAKLCKFFPLTMWPIFGQQSAVHWGRYHWLQAHKAADKKCWLLRTITGLRKKLNELGLYWIALLHLNHCVNFQCKIFVKKWPSSFDCSSSTTRYYWSAVGLGSYVLSNVRPNVCVGQPAGGLGLLHKVRWS